ncbi:MAG TPA: hypothetical protein PLQ19_09075 [Aeromicrobium sp.]|nr:hypothetical protein [Aeromicrobium sp.]
MRWILGSVAATIVVVIAIFNVVEDDFVPSGYCVAKVGETRVEVDLEQAKWASLMAAMAHQRGLPPRATSIAIATAYQESKIRNIDYGDRDSIGLFQQRPSQGWGTVEQIMDPIYSTGKFYDDLARVDNYQNLEITVAAQTVQRSAFPDAYADHEADARALASALRGHSKAAFACQSDATEPSDADLTEWLNEAWGPVKVESAEDSQSIKLSGKDVGSRGWALAQFIVANSAEFAVTEVTFDGKRWQSGQKDPGWAKDANASGSEVRFRLAN